MKSQNNHLRQVLNNCYINSIKRNESFGEKIFKTLLMCTYSFFSQLGKYSTTDKAMHSKRAIPFPHGNKYRGFTNVKLTLRISAIIKTKNR